MSKRLRLLLDTARRYAPQGAVCDIDQRGKHPAITIALSGHTHRLVMPGTPRSDDRCQQNFLRQSIQRLTKELSL